MELAAVISKQMISTTPAVSVDRTSMTTRPLSVQGLAPSLGATSVGQPKRNAKSLGAPTAAEVPSAGLVHPAPHSKVVTNPHSIHYRDYSKQELEDAIKLFRALPLCLEEQEHYHEQSLCSGTLSTEWKTYESQESAMNTLFQDLCSMKEASIKEGSHVEDSATSTLSFPMRLANIIPSVTQLAERIQRMEDRVGSKQGVPTAALTDHLADLYQDLERVEVFLFETFKRLAFSKCSGASKHRPARDLIIAGPGKQLDDRVRSVAAMTRLCRSLQPHPAGRVHNMFVFTESNNIATRLV